MIKRTQGYSYNDLTIIPAIVSDISSRSEVNPFDEKGNLPLFTAPMSTVVNKDNIDLWEKNNIIPIIPRNISIEERKLNMINDKWVALSLSEAKDIFIDHHWVGFAKICIDVANGHMKCLIDLCKEIKNIYGDCVTIMTGNIANPETIRDYNKAGIDYVRCSIGSGAACTTAPNTSVHYPIASLIDECKQLKDYHNLKIKIVADGGIRNYGDVIKALAIGADYVMVGSVFAGLFESAAPLLGMYRPYQTYCPNIYERTTINVEDIHNDEDIKRWILSKNEFTKEFYGMSTKEAQKMIKPESELKTSEGTKKKLEVKYTIKQWTDNMESYLRSAMSYCNAKSLYHFIGKQNLIINSPAEIQAVNK